MREKRDVPLKYSQNFLRDLNLVRLIVSKSSICRNDIVYEIGPGKGIITEVLSSNCKKLIAIEKDKGLYRRLLHKFKGNPRVEIKYGDFLNFNLPAKGKYKIFSNIPFNLTADIVGKITSTGNPPEDAYLIVQKEAAKRFSGLPFAKEQQYSLLLKPWFVVKVIHSFRRTDFYPIPAVDIVLLQIKKRKNPIIKKEESEAYRDFIVYSFNQWKPNLKDALKKVFTSEQFRRLAKDLKFETSARPTDLSFEQWLGLFRYFLTGVIDFKKDLVRGAENKLRKQQAQLQKSHRTSSRYHRR